MEAFHSEHNCREFSTWWTNELCWLIELDQQPWTFCTRGSCYKSYPLFSILIFLSTSMQYAANVTKVPPTSQKGWIQLPLVKIYFQKIICNYIIQFTKTYKIFIDCCTVSFDPGWQHKNHRNSSFSNCFNSATEKINNKCIVSFFNQFYP